jgi:putative redox protein
MQMRVVLESQGQEPLFRATGEASGQSLWVDVRMGEGVDRRGPRPMELIAMGLGACLADNVVEILKKKRIAFEGLRMEIEADRAPEPPKRFTALTVRVTVKSANLTQEALDKILELSAKYCSAHATLSAGVPIATVGVIEPTNG